MVALLFAEELVAAKTVSAVVTLNGFVQFMRTSTLVFRDATGTFYYDRWKPLLEGVVNIVLSVFLVRRIGVTGVIVATILTNLLICHIVEPYVLYTHALEASPARYYLRNYGMILLFGIGMLLVDCVTLKWDSHLTAFFINGCTSVAISLVLCVGMILTNREASRLLLDVIRRKKR